MKRLTEQDKNGTAMAACCGENCKHNFYCENGGFSECGDMDDIIDRLAAIEDLLGDEYDLKDIEKALWCKKIVETAFSDDTQAVERLRELWFADQKGHCVVFDKHYPVVSEYYQDEDGRYIREASGVISEAEYKRAMGDGLK